MKPEFRDLDSNIRKMKSFVDEIMELRPETDLIVFPELSTSGYECTKEEFALLAEKIDMDSVSLKSLSESCKKYGVNIVYGLPESDTGIPGVYHNSVVMLGNDGSLLGSYRKVHPFGGESLWCKAGGEINVIDTPIGKVGLMICWDTAFPEVARIYALQGAELLIVSSNWGAPYHEDWELVTRARAMDNTLHLVSSNRVGKDIEFPFYGHSNIISPDGKIIASLDNDSEGLVFAELDLSLTAVLREELYTFFEDRKPECYGEIVRPL